MALGICWGVTGQSRSAAGRPKLASRASSLMPGKLAGGIATGLLHTVGSFAWALEKSQKQEPPSPCLVVSLHHPLLAGPSIAPAGGGEMSPGSSSHVSNREGEVDLGLRGNGLLTGTVIRAPFPGLLCTLKLEIHYLGHEGCCPWGEPRVGSHDWLDIDQGPL